MESTGDHVMCIHVIKISEYLTIKCTLIDAYVVYMSLIRFSELHFHCILQTFHCLVMQWLLALLFHFVQCFLHSLDFLFFQNQSLCTHR